MTPRELEALGIGLAKEQVRLVRAEDSWQQAGALLAQDSAATLGGLALDVEHVGSSSVPGLLCKPIIDLAAALAPRAPISEVVDALSSDGWVYRGDAGASGALVFVLEVRPLHRVAHLHAVPHGDVQWQHYLVFRDRLRADATARTSYEEAKLRLTRDFPDDRLAYAAGKDDVVREIRDEGHA